MNLLMIALAILLPHGTTQTLPVLTGSAELSSPALPDTFRIDDPQPVLSPEAFDSLIELWQAGRYRGACLSGEVRRDTNGGSVLYITHAFSADFLNGCRGHRNVGAMVFMYEEMAANDAKVGQQTARLLIEHPGWLVVGAITGIEERMARNAGGSIEATAELSAQFSVWTRTGMQTRT